MRVSLVRAVTVAAAALAVALLTGCGGAQYTQVSAGENFSCGLRADGSVLCWGSDEYGQLLVPEDERFTAIESGGSHACGLKSDGITACWGYETEFAEEGPEVSRASYSPPFPPETEQFESISTNGPATCGIRTDGSVACWQQGWELRGVYFPFDTEQVNEISAGGYGVCGLRSDDSVLCHAYGITSLEGERFVSISLALAHICGLRSNGSVLCWGSDIADQLTPPEDGSFSAVSAGTLHTCALRVNGSAVCWGYDLARVEEIYDPPVGHDPTQLAGIHRLPLPEDERFTAITVGSGHACGLRTDGGISCWGNNDHGQATPPAPETSEAKLAA